MFLEVKYLDFVAAKMHNKIPEDHTCRSCKYYDKNNSRHGLCKLFESDTCAEASCSKYKYYKDTRKL